VTKYGHIWPEIQSFYKRAKLFFFILPPLIVFIAAYFLIPGFRQLLASAHGWFVIMVVIGSFILFVDVAWLLLYRQQKAILDKTSRTLPVDCPFCGRKFQLEKEDRKLPFGFPAARFSGAPGAGYEWN
jgi:hypothetical protein